MKPNWFKPRRYKHFDVPVGANFAEKVARTGFAAQHSFSPHISYIKTEKRYRPTDPKKPHLGRQIKIKNREIMYASHRDACILGYYSDQLGQRLEETYKGTNLHDCVIAYRRLGKANYHFAADALGYARANVPCSVLAFDVSGFFDSLDHAILKRRLKSVLGVSELSPDWYAVFRQVTQFRKVALNDLRAHPVFGVRISDKTPRPIATVAELKAAGVTIQPNPHKYGIPQGTPISSAFANLYMIEVDRTIAAACNKVGAFYRRYSDDILIICKPEDKLRLESVVLDAVDSERLTINIDKTERTLFEVAGDRSAQYLGFSLHPSGAALRQSSLSRQWRKLRQAAKRIKKVGAEAIATGRATKIYTRKLRKRFSPLPLRNFSSYARRSAEELDSKVIRRQARRLERELERIISGF
ncbi:group II intron reverse transcriptase domain-containing protein [Microvirga sp. BT688]|uniref:reverse transcriptase/maturase family protein n=1 Tax=Microvirga sp. TaxID=1873136 RepID=UPI001686E4D5|nr:reverse transcriptase/maturase family protein [Microvirga sp.]MBD2747764.1 group II intron reverse transcriptase domain-containing protein [Microvirga sp.]